MMSERPSDIINSELFKLDEENFEKKDLKYVRQSMYRERRKLHPVQLKNQAEFHNMHVTVTNLFQDVVIKSCRFHLGQAWWKKIQTLDLAKEYKKNVTDISKWLHHFFGLAFLNPEDVGDSFAEDLIPDMPSDNKVQDFADYVVSTYVDDNAMFPPSVWAEIPSKSRRTNNGPEAFHSHYNEQFYYSHPTTFVFLDTLTKIQATTSIKIRSTSSEAAEVNMIRKRKTLQWKNTKNYYEVKLAESSMFAF
jgi:hypothetical protein